MELSQEQIIKALECCASPEYKCEECPIDQNKKDDCKCAEFLAQNALALIKELTQECKKWQGRLEIECEYTRADTVKKMAAILERKRVHRGDLTFRAVDPAVLEEVKKEMLGELKA